MFISCVLSAGSARIGARAVSSRGSTATGSSPGANDAAASAGLQAYSEAEAWLQQGMHLAVHGQYASAKVTTLSAVHTLPHQIITCVLMSSSKAMLTFEAVNGVVKTRLNVKRTNKHLKEHRCQSLNAAA